MIFTSYIAYLHLENGKKIRINKTFGTKAEAQKELKIAEKELKSVVGIAKTEIVSTSPAKPKKPAASKPASIPHGNGRPSPIKNQILLKFSDPDRRDYKHIIGIGPTQLKIIQQTFTSFKCSEVYITTTSTKMRMVAIDDNRISIIDMTVPIRTASAFKGIVDPKYFKRDLTYLPYERYRTPSFMKMWDKITNVEHQASVNAKSLYALTSPFSRQAKKYSVVVKIGQDRSSAYVTEIGENNNALTTPLVMNTSRSYGTAKSLYDPGYISKAAKIYGSSIISIGINEQYPIVIYGIYQGIETTVVVAPRVNS